MTTAPTSGSNMTDSFENIIINHVLRSASSSGSSAYLSLYVTLDEEDFSTSIELANSGSYFRQDVVDYFSISNGSAILNTDKEYWRASVNWGSLPIIAFAITDASTIGSGTPYIYGALNTPRTISERDVPKIISGSLSFSLYGHYSPALSGSLLKHYFATEVYPSPTEIFIGLYTRTSPTSASVELSGSTGYERVPWQGTASWVAPSSGSTANSASIIFTYDAQDDWGDVYGAAIFDSFELGDCLFIAPISPSRTILQGNGFKFNEGQLKIYLD